MHTAVNACDCTQGQYEMNTIILRESALKAESGRKVVCCARESNQHQIQRPVWLDAQCVDDDDCFYVALFSALKQTHCARMWFYMMLSYIPATFPTSWPSRCGKAGAFPLLFLLHASFLLLLLLLFLALRGLCPFLCVCLSAAPICCAAIGVGEITQCAGQPHYDNTSSPDPHVNTASVSLRLVKWSVANCLKAFVIQYHLETIATKCLPYTISYNIYQLQIYNIIMAGT